MKKKYKLISEDLQKSLVEFLDEIQFDAAGDTNKDSLHKVNFCNWAINELLNGYDAYVKPDKKSRDNYVDETFMDWNLPEMTDEEYEKLVDQFDGFLRSWEKKYLKDNPQKKSNEKENTITEQKTPYKPRVEDVAEYCSLDEIKDMLLDDPELTDEERFELYYNEHDRIETQKSYKKAEREMGKMLKGLGIKPFKN